MHLPTRSPFERIALLTLVALVPLLAAQTTPPSTPVSLGTPMQLLERNRSNGAEPRPDAIIVDAHADVSADRIAARATSLDCRLLSQLGHRPVFIIQCPTDRPLADLIEQWWQLPEVAWTEASYREYDDREPNDLDDAQWHHHNHGQTIDDREGVPGADIDTPAAWDIQTGDRDVVIAPLDSGLYTEHEDLEDRIWEADDESCDSGFDDDGDGYVDDCRGWDAGEHHNDPSPRTLPETDDEGDTCVRWHGSMIGGLAGATGGNDAGIAGVGWDFELMNVKRHRDDECTSYTANSMQAAAYAIDNGADILVMSFYSDAYSAIFERILQDGDRQGVVTVMSAGNDGGDADEMTRYPQGYDLRNKLIVANTTNRDELSDGSNWGSETVHLAAPGTDLRGPGVDAHDSYRTRSGTSYAAPVVAGAAGLVMSAFPNLRGEDVVDAIIAGVEPLSNLDCANTDTCVASGGRLDVRGALRKASDRAGPARLVYRDHRLAPPVGNPEDLQPMGPGDNADLHVTVGNEGSDADAVTARLQPTPATSDHIVFPDPEVPLGEVAGGTERLETDEPMSFRVADDCTERVDTTVELAVRDETGHGLARSLEVTLDCLVDADGDGYERPADCDDDNPEVHPDATEVCDGIDNNCSGIVDTNATDRRRWWRDADGDGTGDPDDMKLACTRPDGYVDNFDDCDDSDSSVYPGADGWTLDCERVDEPPDDLSGCGCAAGGSNSPVPWLVVSLAGLVVVRRRR